MALTITHPFVSAIADDPAAAAAGQVVPSNWNATHTISGTLPSANIAPAGSTTQVQFNLAGVMSADSGFTYAGSNGVVGVGGNLNITPSSANTEGLTIALGTLTANTKGINLTGTWNSAGTTFDAPLFVNILNTASNFNSILMDLQVGGVSQLNFAPLANGNSFPLLTMPVNGSAIFVNASSKLGYINIASNNGLSQTAISFIGWTSGGNPGSTVPDTILTRAAAANIQFGAANVNGAPVAQTLSFQGALAGSATNQASANTTIIGSLGTGTGTNGDIIFQTGVKTTTGTAQATPTTVLTLKGETGGILFTPLGVNRLDYGVTIPSQWSLGGNLTLTTGNIVVGGAVIYFNGSFNTLLQGATAATFAFGGSDAASPVAQTLSVQNVVGGTAATNGVNWTLIGSLSTGTGVSGDIIFKTGLNPGSGTTQAAATTAFTIKGESQAVWLSSTLVDVGYTYSQPTTGQTVTLGNKDWHTIIDPAGALLALTVQMPASPVDGQLIDFKVSQAITTLTVSPNSGQSVVGGPAAGASVAGITYNAIYRSANTTWYF